MAHKLVDLLNADVGTMPGAVVECCDHLARQLGAGRAVRGLQTLTAY
jgi:hypothetical protein